MMHIRLKQWREVVGNHIQVAWPSVMPYCILVTLFLLNLCVMWPGQMSPDSYTQYKAATCGIFDDHHPPMMSLLWGFLDAIHKGPGLLFLFHLTLLYLGCAYFIAAARSRMIAIAYSFLPLVPHIVLYSSMVWKDVGFAFSFVLVVAMLHYYTQRKKALSVFAILAIVLLVFYGMAVKFQGKYVMPWMILGLWYCVDYYRITYATIIKAALTSCALLYALHSFNDFFVPLERKAHSWQCVKLYDLAGMSVQAHELLFPSFITAQKQCSFDTIKKRFNYQRVDDLFMPPDNPVRIGSNAQERASLLRYWQEMVSNNPWLYVRHRFKNWWNMVTNMPLKHLETMDFSQFGGLHWFVTLQEKMEQKPTTVVDFFYYCAGHLIYYFLYYIRYCFTFIFLIPCMLFYFCLGVRTLRNSSDGISLVLMNGMAISFLIVLFFCSMASDMRYAYIAACLVHASHGIAFDLLHAKKRNEVHEKRINQNV